MIEASGGNGGSGDWGGGGGGGGRIKLFYETGEISDGATFDVDGGVPGGSIFAVSGGSRGTVYDQQRSPQVETLTPSAAYYGDEVALTGDGFGATAGQVRFYDVGGAVVSWSEALVATTVPVDIFTNEVFLVRDGLASNGVELRILNAIVTTVTRTNTAPEMYCDFGFCVGDTLAVSGFGFGAEQGDSDVVLRRSYDGMTAFASDYGTWSETNIEVVLGCAPVDGGWNQLQVVVDGQPSNTTEIYANAPMAMFLNSTNATAGSEILAYFDEFSINPNTIETLTAQFGNSGPVAATFDMDYRAVRVVVPADAPTTQEPLTLTVNGCPVWCDPFTCLFTRTP